MHFAPGRHHRDPAAGVLQLAHVAWPWQVLQVFLGLAFQKLRLDRQLQGGAAEEVAGEGGDIFAAVRHAGDVDANHVEAMEQVLTELARMHQGFQVLVSRGDDAHINLDRCVTAHAVELAVRQYAQQASLGVGRHIADLIEEQRAAIRLFKASATQVGGAGERAFLMAEQLGLHQVLGDRCHVQCDKRRRCPWAMTVQSVGYQLFTGTRLAVDQHGDVGVAQAPDGAKHFLHRRRFTDDFRGAGQGRRGFLILVVPGRAGWRA